MPGIVLIVPYPSLPVNHFTFIPAIQQIKSADILLLLLLFIHILPPSINGFAYLLPLKNHRSETLQHPAFLHLLSHCPAISFSGRTLDFTLFSAEHSCCSIGLALLIPLKIRTCFSIRFGCCKSFTISPGFACCYFEITLKA